MAVKKTVATLQKFVSETKALKFPTIANVMKINKDIKALFDNAAGKGVQVTVEIWYDEGTKQITELKSRLGGGGTITQWP
jgi:hypothetical protein